MLDAEVSRHLEDLLWSEESEPVSASIVSRFANLESFVFSLRLLRRGLRKSVATSAEHYASLRHYLITSHAIMSAVHFLIGR